MTNLERFHSIMEGRPADRLPLDIQLTEPVAKRLATLPDCAVRSDTREIHVNYRYSRQDWVDAYARLGVGIPPHAISYPMGIFFIPDPSATEETAHLSAHLHSLEGVESVDQLEALPWPDLEDTAHYADLAERVAAIRAEDRISVAIMDCSVFEHSWYLRGMERLFEDIYDENPVGFWLMDIFTRRSCVAVRALAEAEVDVIRLGDDIGTQHAMLMAPDFWREHLKPRLAEIVRSAKAAGPPKILYHSDGAIEPVIPDLIEAGIDILNPVQPECMNVRDVVTKFRDKIAFWGMIGTQTTLPFGKPEDVRMAVAEIYELADTGARCVIAPSHVVEPEVPLENLVALVDAVKKRS